MFPLTSVAGFTGYRCRCPGGYSGDYCQVDIDECLSSPCPANYSCVNRVGRYECFCPPTWPCHVTPPPLESWAGGAGVCGERRRPRFHCPCRCLRHRVEKGVSCAGSFFLSVIKQSFSVSLWTHISASFAYIRVTFWSLSSGSTGMVHIFSLFSKFFRPSSSIFRKAIRGVYIFISS